MENFLSSIISLFFPNRCPFCQKLMNNSSCECLECKNWLPREPFIQSFCEDLFICISALEFSGLAREAILRYKFKKHKQYAYAFAQIMKESTKKFSDVDFITNVPIWHKNKVTRGYDQSQILAQKLASVLNLDYKNSLIKTKNNLPQRSLSRIQRVENVEGVYSSIDCAIIKGKKILLCDDIITTGSTLAQCVSVLKAAGAKEVVCCTLAVSLCRKPIFNNKPLQN